MKLKKRRDSPWHPCVFYIIYPIKHELPQAFCSSP